MTAKNARADGRGRRQCSSRGAHQNDDEVVMASTTPPCEDHGRDFGNGENRFASTPDDIMNTTNRCENTAVRNNELRSLLSHANQELFANVTQAKIQSMVPGVVPRKVPVVNLGEAFLNLP